MSADGSWKASTCTATSCRAQGRKMTECVKHIMIEYFHRCRVKDPNVPVLDVVV